MIEVPPDISASTQAAGPLLLYEANHVEPRLGVAMSALVIQVDWPGLDTVADFIGFDATESVEPENLVYFLHSAITDELKNVPSADVSAEEINDRSIALARTLVFDDVIPWRESPLRGESLAGLMTK